MSESDELGKVFSWDSYRLGYLAAKDTPEGCAVFCPYPVLSSDARDFMMGVEDANDEML